MKKVNEDFFAPRGLKLELVTSAVLKMTIGFDLNAPFVCELSESGGLGLQERRLRALEGHLTSLTFNVPPPSCQTNALERLSAEQVKRQLDKSEKKAIEKREKAYAKLHDSSAPMASQSSVAQSPKSSR